MFTYFLIGAAAVLVLAAVWYQVRTWNRPGRHIPQNAPMDDAGIAEARRQHDIHRGTQTSGGGPS
ncbi:MAG TPA: hypothetical protein VFT70_13380 [Nocardioides sp.]|nr:hypothetical protein [Nocardioides sp.]